MAWLLAIVAALVAVGRPLRPPISKPAATRTVVDHLPLEAVVRRVIDGDTVELADGRRVRYIGIDTPEIRHRQGEQWVKVSQPYGEQAAEANRRLVEGKTVRLEYDVQPYDRYRRLLAYVYVDGHMVNETLAAEGYAQLMTIPPNVKDAARLRELVREARRLKRGLWALEPSAAR